MTELKRRDLLKLFGTAPAAAFVWTHQEVLEAAARAQQARAQAPAGAPYVPRFFTAHEYATIVLLADLIIPRDARSGGASDAGAPEFIDGIVAEQADRQTAMRGGLLWLDNDTRRRFDTDFASASDVQRRQVLDDIAWPARARAEMSQGVRFFTTMRDLVAAGFWSSRIGVADIGYLGNVATVWNGAPADVLQKLGVRY